MKLQIENERTYYKLMRPTTDVGSRVALAYLLGMVCRSGVVRVAFANESFFRALNHCRDIRSSGIQALLRRSL